MTTQGVLRAIDTREGAPKFHAKSLEGTVFNNDSVRGKILLVQFWTTWCPYCKGDQPVIDDLIEEYRDRGLMVLAVDVGESKRTVRRFLDEHPRSCEIALMEDTNLAALFEARQFPLYVLIDRDGKVAGRQNGAGGERSLRRLLRKAAIDAAGESPDTGADELRSSPRR